MQRLTKYRLLVGTFAVATVALATCSVLLQRTAADLRSEAAEARSRAAASETKVAERDQTIDRLKHTVSTSGADQSTLRGAIGAFAHQAEACEALKQAMHVKE